MPACASNRGLVLRPRGERTRLKIAFFLRAENLNLTLCVSVWCVRRVGALGVRPQEPFPLPNLLALSLSRSLSLPNTKTACFILCRRVLALFLCCFWRFSPQCRQNVFASKASCFKCGCPKPVHVPGMPVPNYHMTGMLAPGMPGMVPAAPMVSAEAQQMHLLQTTDDPVVAMKQAVRFDSGPPFTGACAELCNRSAEQSCNLHTCHLHCIQKGREAPRACPPKYYCNSAPPPPPCRGNKAERKRRSILCNSAENDECQNGAFKCP